MKNSKYKRKDYNILRQGETYLASSMVVPAFKIIHLFLNVTLTRYSRYAKSKTKFESRKRLFESNWSSRYRKIIYKLMQHAVIW